MVGKMGLGNGAIYDGVLNKLITKLREKVAKIIHRRKKKHATSHGKR